MYIYIEVITCLLQSGCLPSNIVWKIHVRTKVWTASRGPSSLFAGVALKYAPALDGL